MHPRYAPFKADSSANTNVNDHTKTDYWQYKGGNIKLDKAKLTATKSKAKYGYNSAFGSISVSHGKHIWKIEIVRLTKKICVGISSSIKTTEINFHKQATYPHYAYTSRATKISQNTQYEEYGMNMKCGQIITIILDLNNGYISFMNNCHDLGIAFKQIDVGKNISYRLAASILDKNDCIKIIGYGQLFDDGDDGDDGFDDEKEFEFKQENEKIKPLLIQSIREEISKYKECIFSLKAEIVSKSGGFEEEMNNFDISFKRQLHEQENENQAKINRFKIENEKLLTLKTECNAKIDWLTNENRKYSKNIQLLTKQNEKQTNELLQNISGMQETLRNKENKCESDKNELREENIKLIENEKCIQMELGEQRKEIEILTQQNKQMKEKQQLLNKYKALTEKYKSVENEKNELQRKNEELITDKNKLKIESKKIKQKLMKSLGNQKSVKMELLNNLRKKLKKIETFIFPDIDIGHEQAKKMIYIPGYRYSI